jgi:hypothetical protein
VFVPETAQFVDGNSKRFELVSCLRIYVMERFKLAIIEPLGILRTWDEIVYVLAKEAISKGTNESDDGFCPVASVPMEVRIFHVDSGMSFTIRSLAKFHLNKFQTLFRGNDIIGHGSNSLDFVRVVKVAVPNVHLE